MRLGTAARLGAAAAAPAGCRRTARRLLLVEEGTASCRGRLPPSSSSSLVWPACVFSETFDCFYLAISFAWAGLLYCCD